MYKNSKNHYFSVKPKSSLREYRFRVDLRGFVIEIISASGVFSAKKLDKGTRLLAEKMIIVDGWRILDLGTGYGILGIVAALLSPNGYVVMTDINKRAVKYAKLNLKLNKIRNAEVRWGYLYEPVKSEKFNTIICNPPQSAGMSILRRIIEESIDYLFPDGYLQIVARHNKGGRRLMEIMENVYGNVDTIASSGGYRVYISRKK